MASTWDPPLIQSVGKAIGEELLNKGPAGIEVLLGPAVNIHRTPLGGRVGEYFSEDPYLSARLGVGYIQGVQSTGAAACIKHFVANSQERNRTTVDETISERALREIYLPAFEAGIKEGHVWTVMSSYNKVNGFKDSANSYLLTDVLKRGWGFDGMVMSDWGWVVDEPASVQSGNDLDMPHGSPKFVANLKTALSTGKLTQAAVDDSVRRILRTMIRVRLLDGTIPPPDEKLVDTPEHTRVAYRVAAEGIVLLKNDANLLPLDEKQVRSIAVIGQEAKVMEFDALGSPEVRPLHVVEPLDGIQKRAGAGITVRYAQGRTDGEPLTGDSVILPGDDAAHGFRTEYYGDVDFKGPVVLNRTGDRPQSVCFDYSGA